MSDYLTTAGPDGPGGPAAAHAQYAVGTADVTYVDAARGNRPVPVNLYYRG